MRLDYKHHLLVTCCNQLGGLFRLNLIPGNTLSCWMKIAEV
ncbi:hypothetical protein QFZ77_006778 [Paenibacillus sp. V4I3]|nr:MULTISPECIES: hypothetical protein [unclassified Paenibacillus]MDQ0878119.1 hypothetical protein [Paenibacillus sp. V4I3]MDQ0886059.1 hypothetical protein [Paenibacillus sp. V4I9]